MPIDCTEYFTVGAERCSPWNGRKGSGYEKVVARDREALGARVGSTVTIAVLPGRASAGVEQYARDRQVDAGRETRVACGLIEASVELSDAVAPARGERDCSVDATGRRHRQR